MTTRHFEYSGGNSRKFWEVTVAGCDVTVRFGRIGTAGQVQTKTLASETAAQEHAESLVRSKIRKGYVEAVAK